MKTIIFIGLNKSGSSRDAVRAAEKLGYYIVVFTDRKKQLQQRKEYPDVHHLILLDLNNIEQLKDQIKALQQRGHKIVSITSFVDHHVHTASRLADEFCHNYLSTKAIFIMENKNQTRSFFADKPYTPAFLLINKDTKLPIERLPETFHYPLMLKCSQSTGSKDVVFVTNLEELQINLSRLRENNPKDTIIIEEYIEGEQYLVETLIVNEQIQKAAIIKQEITQGKRFIVTGYGVLADVDPELEKGIDEILQSIVSTLKIKNGAFHVELRLTAGGWKLIEINPRISGGAMNRMIQVAFGYNLVEETLKLLIGETPSLKKKTNYFVFTQYKIINKKGILEKVTGRKKARKSQGIAEVYVKPRKGAVIKPPMSMGHRYAYVIAKGDTLETAHRLAKEASQKISFHIKEDNK